VRIAVDARLFPRPLCAALGWEARCLVDLASTHGVQVAAGPANSARFAPGVGAMSADVDVDVIVGGPLRFGQVFATEEGA
jgi:hypothetical protein